MVFRSDPAGFAHAMSLCRKIVMALQQSAT
jgi:hypothetical protein